MTAGLIDGKALAATVRSEAARGVEAFAADHGRPPGLAVVLVGDDPASHVYVKNKRKAAAEVGIRTIDHAPPAAIRQSDLIALVDRLNADETIDAILVQFPLPAHLDAQAVVRRVDPAKDADGLHPENAGLLAMGTPRLVPCTPRGIVKLIDAAGTPIEGKDAVVVGRSNLVGKPVAQLLLARNATVTVCHSRTRDLAAAVGRAEILVAAIGRAEFVRGSWIRPDATVIDVGMNRRQDGTLAGDVEFAAARERAAWITPVPGGVGPMTIACLIENTLQAARARMARMG